MLIKIRFLYYQNYTKKYVHSRQFIFKTHKILLKSERDKSRV